MRELSCRELVECLADYLAGELGPEGRSLFEGHSSECPDCVTYLRSYTATMRLVRDAYEDAPVPAPLLAQLVRAILAASLNDKARTPQ